MLKPHRYFGYFWQQQTWVTWFKIGSHQVIALVISSNMTHKRYSQTQRCGFVRWHFLLGEEQYLLGYPSRITCAETKHLT